MTLPPSGSLLIAIFELMELPNLTKESFNPDLCNYLEYHLTRTLSKSNDNEVQRLWCDGVSMPLDAQLTKTIINDTRKILTSAWIGIDGQSVFEMTIKFGRRSLRKYARGLNLLDCIPRDDTLEWITLDLDAKTIELQLM